MHFSPTKGLYTIECYIMLCFVLFLASVAAMYVNILPIRVMLTFEGWQRYRYQAVGKNHHFREKRVICVPVFLSGFEGEARAFRDTHHCTDPTLMVNCIDFH